MRPLLPPPHLPECLTSALLPLPDQRQAVLHGDKATHRQDLLQVLFRMSQMRSLPPPVPGERTDGSKHASMPTGDKPTCVLQGTPPRTPLPPSVRRIASTRPE